MEITSQQNPSDSFSFSWLMNINPSIDTTLINESLRFSFDTLETGSFIDMDPKLISMRWSTTYDSLHDIDFNLPSCQTPVMVPADQIFSDGRLLPLQHPPGISSDQSVLNRSLSLDSCKSLLSRSNRHHGMQSGFAHATPARLSSLPASSNINHKYSKSPKKFICKYFCFLMPFYKKMKCFRLMAPVRSARIYTDSVETSPRTSNVYATMLDMRSESIHDAVLYCKNSNIGGGLNKS